jgi:Protein of unknown function (DUF2442)
MPRYAWDRVSKLARSYQHHRADSNGYDARTLRTLLGVVIDNKALIEKVWTMITSPKAVRFDDDTLWVRLADGRTIAAPLTWFPRLLQADPEQRSRVEFSQRGMHWDELDEDISVEGLLSGWPDLSGVLLSVNE